jgi:hypothetical protein
MLHEFDWVSNNLHGPMVKRMNCFNAFEKGICLFKRPYTGYSNFLQLRHLRLSHVKKKPVYHQWQQKKRVGAGGF